ncbi:NAD(P)H-binding protein [Nocardia brasiliensis]|uniref:NAD(P)H-binding protein n=1 Tax=Nocardia brasiliensis TaxID=37326 RepID=UPI002455D640|nr:NAD(P)H-binding protein [Nocardia brasiliensis]
MATVGEVLVIGATGTTGRRVAEFLRERDVALRLATRTPGTAPGQVRFDWTDPATHAPATTGVSALYLVAPIGVHEPVPLVEPFLKTAVREGVQRVVLLGSSAVPAGPAGLGALYGLVRDIAVEWTVLRPSWFMQNFTGDHSVALGVRDGEIVTATGAGRVAFIDADDIAAVAGHALTDPAPHDTEHILTGPAALGYGETAAILTARLGRVVTHRSVSVAELTARHIEFGLPRDFAAALAQLDDDIRGGAEDRVTDTVARVTGRPPRSFADFVRNALPGHSSVPGAAR